jgi:hypothetical protein
MYSTCLVGLSHHSMALPQAGYKEDNFQIWKGTTNSWIRGGDVPAACMLDMGLWGEVSMGGYLPHINSCWCLTGLVS